MLANISIFILFLLCVSCREQKADKTAKPILRGEYITRHQQDSAFKLNPPQFLQAPTYPWEEKFAGKHPKITKDFFRCKGSSLNPARIIEFKGEPVRHEDCCGSEKHGLPLRDNKEFIYPILIELLNEIQQKTGKRVVITSGHRCPEHNTFVDPSVENQTSKHQIGAEVSFYVQGMEDKPEQVVYLIQQHYKDQKGLSDFQRYDKPVNVTTPPWYNKEIFIKLFKKNEGRNFDNRHPYPYISIQVRFDSETQEKVIYTWEKAHKHYHRK